MQQMTLPYCGIQNLDVSIGSEIPPSMVFSRKKITPLFLSEIRPLWVKKILHLVPFPLPWRIFAINIGVFSLHCLSNIYVLFESATFYHDMGDIHHFLPCITYISVYLCIHVDLCICVYFFICMSQCISVYLCISSRKSFHVASLAPSP